MVNRFTLVLTYLCILPFVSHAQRSWAPASVVRQSNAADTLRGWFRYQQKQVLFQPIQGAQQILTASEIKELRTERGELFIPAPPQLATYTSSGLVSEIVRGEVSLLHDYFGPEESYFLAMPQDQVVELKRNNFLQQIQMALPGCPVTSADSLEARAKTLRYVARDLGPLLTRYNRCRWPASGTQFVQTQAAAHLTAGIRAGAQSYQLSYHKTDLFQNTDFAQQTAFTGGIFTRLTFNQRFYLQPELSYQQLRAEGSTSIPTGTTTFLRNTNSRFDRQLVIGNMLARYHFGLPIEGRWRPVLLGGLSVGYAFKSEYSVQTTITYSDETPTIVLVEPATTGSWNTGYIIGIGVEAPVGRHRPTVELRHITTAFDATSSVKRQLKAQIWDAQLSWSW